MNTIWKLTDTKQCELTCSYMSDCEFQEALNSNLFQIIKTVPVCKGSKDEPH